MLNQKFAVSDLQGVVAVTPTPAPPSADQLDARNTVDLSESDRMVRALVQAGVDAIMTNGTLGEMATLTEDEWRAFARTVAQAVTEVAPDMPVFIGATSSNTRDTAARIAFLHEIGIRGAFLGRPMGSSLGPDALYNYIVRSPTRIRKWRWCFMTTRQHSGDPFPHQSMQNSQRSGKSLASNTLRLHRSTSQI